VETVYLNASGDIGKKKKGVGSTTCTAPEGRKRIGKWKGQEKKGGVGNQGAGHRVVRHFCSLSGKGGVAPRD